MFGRALSLIIRGSGGKRSHESGERGGKVSGEEAEHVAAVKDEDVEGLTDDVLIGAPGSEVGEFVVRSEWHEISPVV